MATKPLPSQIPYGTKVLDGAWNSVGQGFLGQKKMPSGLTFPLYGCLAK